MSEQLNPHKVKPRRDSMYRSVALSSRWYSVIPLPLAKKSKFWCWLVSVPVAQALTTHWIHWGTLRDWRSVNHNNSRWCPSRLKGKLEEPRHPRQSIQSRRSLRLRHAKICKDSSHSQNIKTWNLTCQPSSRSGPCNRRSNLISLWLKLRLSLLMSRWLLSRTMSLTWLTTGCWKMILRLRSRNQEAPHL